MIGKEFTLTLPMDGQYIVRSETNEAGVEEEWLYLEGEASDTTWDRKRGKVYPEAIRRMVDTVNGAFRSPVFSNTKVARSAQNSPEPVGVDVDHSNRWNDQIGEIVEAKVLERAEGLSMWVKRRIDLGLSAGRDLKRSLDKGTKLGWSIFGHVTDYEKDQDGREHFRQIDLKKIRVTSKPVNSNTWLSRVARSMGDDMEEEVTEQESPEVSPEVEAPVLERAATGKKKKSDPEEKGETEGEEANEGPEDEPASQEAAEEANEEDEPAPGKKKAAKRSEGDEFAEAAEALKSLEAAPTPVVRAETPRVDLTNYILRSELERVTEPYILRSEVEDEFSKVREIMRGLPGIVTKVLEYQADVEVLRSENSELRASNRNLVNHLNELTRVINGILETPMGRPGMRVARSMQEEANDEVSSSEVWPGVSEQERLRRYRELSRTGQRELAMQIKLGIADVETANKVDFSHLSKGARKQIESGRPMGS